MPNTVAIISDIQIIVTAIRSSAGNQLDIRVVEACERLMIGMLTDIKRIADALERQDL